MEERIRALFPAVGGLIEKGRLKEALDQVQTVASGLAISAPEILFQRLDKQVVNEELERLNATR